MLYLLTRQEGLMDFRLELILLPVTDVDRARHFYERAGFRLDVDHQASEDFRVVQLTPPGSACSIAFGVGFITSPPGCVSGLHLVVSDIESARSELAASGIEVEDIRHMTPGGWAPGVDPVHADYNSYAGFSDPDGNSWLLQEVRYQRAADI
jgi:catechol 2,3-dioxygenase-like lactoylglutathione lyase family enzyme